MQNLNLSNINFILLISCLFGCSTTSSYYKVKNADSDRTELLVTSDRIILECEPQLPNKSMFGFVIHVLDDQNSVVNVVRTNTIDQSFCKKEYSIVSKILQLGREIYIGGMGTITDPRKKEKSCIEYPGKGNFCSNGRSLQFMVITNEKGNCYSAYDGFDQPCPGAEFPIR